MREATEIATRIIANSDFSSNRIIILAASHVEMEAALRTIRIHLHKALEVRDYYGPKAEIHESLRIIYRTLKEVYDERGNARPV